MESIGYTSQMLINKIKEDFPDFNEMELLDFTKFVIPHVHLFLREGKCDQAKKYCSDDMIKKMLDNKEIYRLSPDIDSARVGYARLEDYTNKEDEVSICVYTSIFFYDEVSNNKVIDEKNNFDKYWNDIWQIKFRTKLEKNAIIMCPTCQTQMTYNRSKNMYTCENCKNSIYYSKINWEIVDIDVNKVNYI